MGGAAAGEVASRVAVDEVHAVYENSPRNASARDMLGRAFEAANRAIRMRSRADAELNGMGTTCTAASIVGRNLIVAHVGDSRAYLVREGSIEQISTDHTVASELAKMGSAPSAASHVLTRSLGTQERVAVDLLSKPIQLAAGQAVVLCSDGLSGMVEADEILDVVQEEAPESACHTLVELARARGGPDNITVVIAKLVQG
jgi:protein phosphatase